LQFILPDQAFFVNSDYRSWHFSQIIDGFQKPFMQGTQMLNPHFLVL
jgi:hypothetical protein